MVLNRPETSTREHGTMSDDQLVAQRRARTNHERERMDQPNDDGHDDSSVVGIGCKLKSTQAVRSFGGHNYRSAA
jgi:hypothetical protein